MDSSPRPNDNLSRAVRTAKWVQQLDTSTEETQPSLNIFKDNSTPVATAGISVTMTHPSTDQGFNVVTNDTEDLNSIQYMPQRGLRPQRLVLSAKFALCDMQENGKVEGGRIYTGAGFPVLPKDVLSLDSLISLQQKHFLFTYHYHGLKTTNIAAYELVVPVQTGYIHQGLCKSEIQWTHTITAICNSFTHLCDPNEHCIRCENPPILIIYFQKSAWEDALDANKRDLKYSTFTLLDTYCEEYATLLRSSNERAFKRYIRLCQSVHHGLSLRGLPGLCVAIPNMDNTHNDDGLIRAATSLSTQEHLNGNNDRKSRVATTGSIDTPSKKSRRLAPETPRTIKIKSAEDFRSVSIKPLGDTKLETDRCFTCVQLGRSCSGTKIIDGRCEMCATKRGKSGSRKCYWRQPGIETYEQAKAADGNAIKNQKNTRAGRMQRAQTQSNANANEDGDVLE